MTALPERSRRPTRRTVAALVVLSLLLAACGLEQRGPWRNAAGRELMGSEVIEYRGFGACDWEQVIFLEFFGDTYAKDPDRVLGTLTSPDDGDELTFAVLDEPPPGVEATGITQGGREILVGDDRVDYLYIRLPGGDVERWPRAEVACERR